MEPLWLDDRIAKLKCKDSMKVVEDFYLLGINIPVEEYLYWVERMDIDIEGYALELYEGNVYLKRKAGIPYYID